VRSVRIHGKGDIRIEDIDEPVLQPGTVILSGGYTGVCGSDLHMFFAPESLSWDFSRPAELTGAVWPQILGHEFSGRVVAVADDVETIAPGDLVAVLPYHTCGWCAACVAGREMFCPLITLEGILGRSGGMAARKIVEARDCFVLPEGLDLRFGALVEPMAVAWHGVTLAAPEADRGALVVGGGPIGVGAYFALKAFGVETVVVSEPSADRRAILAGLGVEHLVDPTTESVVGRCRELTSGAGVQVGIDCAGAPRAFPESMRALSLGGRMVIVAAYESPIEMHSSLLLGDKSIRSSVVYTREDFAAVIDAMGRGLYRSDGWIDTIEFEGVEGALHDLRAGRRMKVLVRTP
jgi:(R,R)-butanediol dehydrogenase/meso-butanediol dehydrogenase/diacetyl reductase